MSEVFKARRHGRVQLQLPGDAAGLLSSLAGQLIELLRDGEATSQVTDPLEEIVGMSDTHREPPSDAALRRLLPDGFTDPNGQTSDPEAAAEFRRFTERGLRDGKVADAHVVLDTIGTTTDGTARDAVDVELDEDQVGSWMRCLNDMRLTIGARLEVAADDEEKWAELAADDPRGPIYEIYVWLGYLLEDLLGELS